MFAKYPQNLWTKVPDELAYLYKMSVCTRAITISEMLPFLENESHGPYIKKTFFMEDLFVNNKDCDDEFLKATIEGVIPSVRWALVSILFETEGSRSPSFMKWLFKHPEYLGNQRHINMCYPDDRIIVAIQCGLDVKNNPRFTWNGDVLIEALKHGMPMFKDSSWFSNKVESNKMVLDYVLNSRKLTLEYMYQYIPKFRSRKILFYFLELFLEDQLSIDLIRLICSFS